jgi:hypothetical protein
MLVSFISNTKGVATWTVTAYPSTAPTLTPSPFPMDSVVLTHGHAVQFPGDPQA